MNQPIVFLCGYGQSNRAGTLFARAEALNALVIDVRLTPWCNRMRHPEEFRKDNLQARFGSRYLHLKEWGNRNYRSADREKGFAIADFDGGIETWKEYLLHCADNGQVFDCFILLCQCRSERSCHRGELGKRLEEIGFAVLPLDWNLERISSRRRVGKSSGTLTLAL